MRSLCELMGAVIVVLVIGFLAYERPPMCMVQSEGIALDYHPHDEE